MTQKIIYESIPPFCEACSHVGHKMEDCYIHGGKPRPPRRNSPKPQKKESSGNDDQFLPTKSTQSYPFLDPPQQPQTQTRASPSPSTLDSNPFGPLSLILHNDIREEGEISDNESTQNTSDSESNGTLSDAPETSHYVIPVLDNGPNSLAVNLQQPPILRDNSNFISDSRTDTYSKELTFLRKNGEDNISFEKVDALRGGVCGTRPSPSVDRQQLWKSGNIDLSAVDSGQLHDLGPFDRSNSTDLNVDLVKVTSLSSLSLSCPTPSFISHDKIPKNMAADNTILNSSSINLKKEKKTFNSSSNRLKNSASPSPLCLILRPILPPLI